MYRIQLKAENGICGCSWSRWGVITCIWQGLRECGLVDASKAWRICVTEWAVKVFHLCINLNHVRRLSLDFAKYSGPEWQTNLYMCVRGELSESRRTFAQNCQPDICWPQREKMRWVYRETGWERENTQCNVDRPKMLSLNGSKVMKNSENRIFHKYQVGGVILIK